MDVKFSCAGCRQPLAASSQYAGQFVQCPTCNQPVTIPLVHQNRFYEKICSLLQISLPANYVAGLAVVVFVWIVFAGFSWSGLLTILFWFSIISFLVVKYGPKLPLNPPVAGRLGPLQYSTLGNQITVVIAKNRGIYIILGLLFGSLGFHNFYANRYWIGTMQLILSVLLFWTLVVPLIVSLVALVELCVVREDGNGVKMT